MAVALYFVVSIYVQNFKLLAVLTVFHVMPHRPTLSEKQNIVKMTNDNQHCPPKILAHVAWHLQTQMSCVAFCHSHCSLLAACRSTSSRTMLFGVSPQTGTLNSRSVRHSQLNMSSGSQVVSASPPALMPLSSYQPQHIDRYQSHLVDRSQPQHASVLSPSSQPQSHAAVRPVCSSPPQQQLPTLSASPRELSPRQLSPMSLSLMSPSMMSPAVAVTAASDVAGHHSPVSPAAGAAAYICFYCYNCYYWFRSSLSVISRDLKKLHDAKKLERPLILLVDKAVM